MIGDILFEIYKKEPNNKQFPVHYVIDNKSLLGLVHSTKTPKEDEC